MDAIKKKMQVRNCFPVEMDEHISRTRYYGIQGFKVAKDEAVDRAETAENALRDANFRVEKAKEEAMALEKKYAQIRNDLTTAQEEMVKANEKLEMKEKTLHQVKRIVVAEAFARRKCSGIRLSNRF